MSQINYKDAGVDTHLAQSLIKKLGQKIKSTHINLPAGSVEDNFGLFAGVFTPNESSRAMDIVATTDGVGTKIELARQFQRFDGLGQDLVAMCVNDLYCLGARPAFFLDYISCGKLEDSWYGAVVSSIASACLMTQMALLGGETAEHPGVMKAGEFDLAGFCVGFVDRQKKLPRMDQMQAGDVIIALKSSGLHSNGFSLVRKVLSSIAESDPDYHAQLMQDQHFLGSLLQPTRIYSEVHELTQRFLIKGIAHITGGGIYENLPRILPDGLIGEITEPRIFNQEIFDFFRKYSQERALYETFNMGVGMILISDQTNAAQIIKAQPDAQIIGKLQKKTQSMQTFEAKVRLKGLDF